MAKKKKNTDNPITEVNTTKAPSASEPAEEGGDGQPSQHHHHDHEHHHHHSHYARSVDSDGNVKETTTDIVEIKEVKEIPAEQIVVSEKNTITPSISISKPKDPSHLSVHTSKKTKSIIPTVTPTPAPPSTKAPTIKPPTVIPTPTPSVKPPSAKDAPPPSSPAPSHKSRSSHHHPEVIVNVTIPQPAPAAPPIILQPPAPVPAEIVETEEIDVEEPVKATPLVVPTEIPPTPKAPTLIAPSPKAPSIRSLAPAKSVKSRAPTVIEEPPEDEVVEETKVITTTTTTTTKKRPPSPPKTPQVISIDNPFVENVETPPPPPSLPKSTKSSKPPAAPALTVPSPALPATPMKLPDFLRCSGGSGEKKPMKLIETTTVEKFYVPDESGNNVEVDTAATTMGGATTKGIGGARSAALTPSPGRRSGTKGGIRPIPMVDYEALIQSTPPHSIKKSYRVLPQARMTPSPQGPKTIVTYSAQLDRDSQGNEHLHARLRDYTGVVKEVDPTMPPASVMGSHPLSPTTYAQTTYVPLPTSVSPVHGAKTVVTYSAQLDRDSQGNEHLHARLRDHTGVTKGLELDTGQGEVLPMIESEEHRKKREKKEKKEAKRLAKEAAKDESKGNPYRHVGGVVPPPKSERYAYPPAPTVIEQNSKERYANKFNNGQGGAPGSGMGMGMGMGMGGMGPPYPPIAPALYPRPPPLIAQRPPMFGPPMMGMGGMGMGMGGMGMGMGAMGMPMMGMGMPMGMSLPMATPIPGVVPGQPGMGYYNSMPGRFGRDMLGRDFAGPGGVGSSQPYRPPDPSALPPMPFGLPFIARPGQEGFDQYGRMLPPDLPEGWDGWGRPLVSTNPQPNIPGGIQPDLPAQIPLTNNVAGIPNGQNQQMPLSSGMYGNSSTNGNAMGNGSISSSSRSSNGTGRPDQPACFDRPPAKSDTYFRYDQFDAFSLHCSSLNYPHQLHLPPELISHDVNEEDWSKFINDLSKEAIKKNYNNSLNSSTSTTTTTYLKGLKFKNNKKEPILNEIIHSLLASWSVGFFQPRGIKIILVSSLNNKRILQNSIEPITQINGYRNAEEFSDEESDFEQYNEFNNLSNDSEEEEKEKEMEELYLPRIERKFRKEERNLIKRRLKKKQNLNNILNNNKNNQTKIGNWEIHFICTTPTIWQKGARPRGYGEPVIRLTR
ncbi:uncharacterized protein I206_101605 [Kwoniella pini CBS 10737]|uniref:Uncharacterized protein n=1 Tax=Kwoniella pini CBS 10737 TaxID=1296096 RepID=A0AAJ8L1B0_9TREE